MAVRPAWIMVTGMPALAAVSAAEQPATPEPIISNRSSCLCCCCSVEDDVDVLLAALRLKEGLLITLRREFRLCLAA